MPERTNWDKVAEVAISTDHDPSKKVINEALVYIFERFEKTLTSYFERRVRDYPALDAEDMFADFRVYIITERKKYFVKQILKGDYKVICIVSPGVLQIDI